MFWFFIINLGCFALFCFIIPYLDFVDEFMFCFILVHNASFSFFMLNNANTGINTDDNALIPTQWCSTDARYHAVMGGNKELLMWQ